MLYGVKVPSGKEGKCRASLWYVFKEFECIGKFACEYGQEGDRWIHYLEIPGDYQKLMAIESTGKFAIPMYPKETCCLANLSDYDEGCEVLAADFREKIQANMDRQIHVFY